MNKKKLVEAALFISGKEIRREELAEMLQMDAADIERLVGRLEKEYLERDSCLIIRKAGAVYKMDIDQGYVEAVKKLAPDVEMRRGVLKALSFIAYKQPVRQSDLVKLLGNRAYDYVNELEDKGFITRERWGRTRKLETTDKFSAYFGTEKFGLEAEIVEGEIVEEENVKEESVEEAIVDKGNAEEGSAGEEAEGGIVEDRAEENRVGEDDAEPKRGEGVEDESNIKP